MPKELSDLAEVGCGPLNFDLQAARRAGWTEALIEDAWAVVSAVARAGYRRAHFGYPVEGCECESCDLTVPTYELAADRYREIRRSWEWIGGDDVYRRRPK